MKLLRYGPPGQERPAVLVEDNRALDVTDHFGDYDHTFFAEGGLNALRDILDSATTGELLNLDEHRIGPPITQPSKIICVGLNYRDHAEESGQPAPDEPILFLKAPNTIVGPNDPILIPPGARQVDWEIELGIVIAAPCRYLDDADAALWAIAGYTISHDVSERDWQMNRGGQWCKGKSFETFNPLGPYLVTPDEVDDVQDLRMQLSVNGEIRQNGTTTDMIFNVTDLITYISHTVVLEPGDLLNTGTPAGVGLGMTPQTWLATGDTVEVQINRLGAQRGQVQAAI